MGNVFATAPSNYKEQSQQSSQQSSLWSDDIIIEDDAMAVVNSPAQSEAAGPSSNIPSPYVQKEALKEHKENIQTLRGKRNKSSKAFEETVTKTFEQIGAYLQTPADTEDEDTLFGKAVGRTLQNICNRKAKARAKIEILEVLEKYED